MSLDDWNPMGYGPYDRGPKPPKEFRITWVGRFTIGLSLAIVATVAFGIVGGDPSAPERPDLFPPSGTVQVCTPSTGGS